MELQSSQHNCRESRGGSTSSRDGLGSASVEKSLPIDGDQCKGGGSIVNTSEVRSKPSVDIIKAKDAKSSKSTHLLNGVSVLFEDHIGDQVNTKAQQTCRGEGAIFGSVRAFDDSVFRGRKNIKEDGMDGLEFEEGSGEFGSSV